LHGAFLRRGLVVLALATLAVLLAAPAGAGTARIAQDRYVVLLAGTQAETGFAFARTHDAALAAVTAAGGTVTRDLSRQIGLLVVHAPQASFADALAASPLVESVGADFSWQGVPHGVGGPEQTSDPMEALQWDMQMMRVPQAHDVQAGDRQVDVGILDTGIDGNHPDFVLDGRGTNVDCARGHNSVEFIPTGPGVGTPNPCVDNAFHGTHVAGTVAAQANGIGVVGVAPNVTLVPVKVCDTSGFCYASGVVDGITYAGDEKLDVINMSFFVDDDEFQQSTEFKCNSDPVQRTFRRAVERAIAYAIKKGVTPVAALGNSDEDLVHPSAADGNDCDVVPAETKGVIGVASLGARSEKASYSNWGFGPTDVAAPGGNGTTGDCQTTILSTLPGATYGCIQGTSMASPHAAGLAALIESQYGKLGSGGDVVLSRDRVADIMFGTAIDIGLRGYDECFGHGRIDALRAVTGNTSNVFLQTPLCPEYNE
jgi:subtilisin family serine protease